MATVIAAVLVVSYSLVGVGGLLVALTAIAAVGVLTAALRVPRAPAPDSRARRPVPVVNAPYRTYRQVTEQLSWARVSPRHFDVVTRPLLQGLMTSRLTERHGVDVHRSPDTARALLGEDVWHWLDPTRPASGHSRPPGLLPHDLTTVVDRLEAL
ncbi:MAG: hypothetical protein ABJA93_07780 [Sporichthyaceae bacterium]